VRLAFLLYKYFPYGGLQRDFHRFVEELGARGHACRVYCIAWQGERLAAVDLRLVPVSAASNTRRNERFWRWVQADLAADPVDGVIGFNKMPGLDVYFAADPCFLDKALHGRSAWYRLGPRYRHFARSECAVFGPDSDTEILLIAATEQRKFEQHYGTTAARMHLLPPGVAPERRAPAERAAAGGRARAALGVKPREQLLLLVGSGFITKGLDRAIRAVASLQQRLPAPGARLLVAGQDRENRFRRLARRLGVQERVSFLGGRDDVAELMLAADVLVHPARNEAAGMVLLEALVAGLPVVVTEVCGYAHHIGAAGAGMVLAEPFRQEELDKALLRTLAAEFNAQCRRGALAYAQRQDLYSMHRTGADLIEQIIGRKRVRADG
jgi:UDP-glucose:(heptosyl)LPS alpha-1,3-glucosyltransferase